MLPRQLPLLAASTTVLTGVAALALRRSVAAASATAHARGIATAVGGGPMRLLVLHGHGVDRRGYEQIEKFGTLTMADYNAEIRKWGNKVRAVACGSPAGLLGYGGRWV